MIKDFLENLKGSNLLTNFVIDHYIYESDNYETPNDLLNSMQELQQFGCSSGMIEELIYYDDTVKFFDKYVYEINDILSKTQEATGYSIEELFGNKFDKSDPLIKNYQNKNLLAWFGFEETASNLYDLICEKLEENQYECINN